MKVHKFGNDYAQRIKFDKLENYVNVETRHESRQYIQEDRVQEEEGERAVEEETHNVSEETSEDIGETRRKGKKAKKENV